MNRDTKRTMGTESTVTINDFDALYRKFGPMVLRRCQFLLKDEEKALDAMQDVFVRIIERSESLTSMCSSFFYTVATRVCLNKMRSDKVRWAPQIDDLLDTIADTCSAQHEDLTDASMLLDTIFSDTKEDTRNMAVLHYVDGLTYEEVAEQTNMSVSGVRKRLAVLKKNALKKTGE